MDDLVCENHVERQKNYCQFFLNQNNYEHEQMDDVFGSEGTLVLEAVATYATSTNFLHDLANHRRVP